MRSGESRYRLRLTRSFLVEARQDVSPVRQRLAPDNGVERRALSVER